MNIINHREKLTLQLNKQHFIVIRYNFFNLLTYKA